MVLPWLTLLVLVLAGCAAPKGRFQVQRDSAYNKKLQRVLVLHPQTDKLLGQAFTAQVARKTSELLTTNGVTSTTLAIDTDALDPNAPISLARAAFGPTQIMQVAIGEVTSVSDMRGATYNTLPRFYSDFSLTCWFTVVDVPSGRTVWRADAQYPSVPKSESVAQQLVEALAKEGFVALSK